MHVRAFMVIILAGLLALPAPARAQVEEMINEEHLPRLSDLVQAQYISGILHGGFISAGQETVLPYVLKLALADGWYTYWRTPGDSGLTPTFEWEGSANVKEARIGWPAPKRFEQEGIYSFGYDGVVEIPVSIIPEKPGEAVNLSLNFNAIVCNKICVPQTLVITHATPAGPATQSPYYQYTKDVAASLPSTAENGDVQLQTAVLGKGGLVFTVFSKDGFEGADLFIESADINLTTPPVITREADNPQAAIISIPAPEGTDLTGVLFGKKITATLVIGNQATEKQFSF